MKIEYANETDLDIINEYDEHISKEELLKSILDKRVTVAKDNDEIIAWTRYNLFWDNTPFLNMIFVLEGHRNSGIGKTLIDFWEKDMKNKNFKRVMTSTLSNESAQHIYRNLGYKDAGSLLLEGEPLEIIFTKEI
ncbi:MAG: GNAT family N-acetyltransferase [Oscillospiraceae bacterium]|nr:GNAT family N-acetyltransferase [Oscillospiraceae bacterium]